MNDLEKNQIKKVPRHVVTIDDLVNDLKNLRSQYSGLVNQVKTPKTGLRIVATALQTKLAGPNAKSSLQEKSGNVFIRGKKAA